MMLRASYASCVFCFPPAMCSSRDVLLVGEGNFSFSVALIESSMDELHVTATCLQTEDEAYRCDGARENVQRIRDCGKVL